MLISANGVRSLQSFETAAMSRRSTSGRRSSRGAFPLVIWASSKRRPAAAAVRHQFVSTARECAASQENMLARAYTGEPRPGARTLGATAGWRVPKPGMGRGPPTITQLRVLTRRSGAEYTLCGFGHGVQPRAGGLWGGAHARAGYLMLTGTCSSPWTRTGASPPRS
jgi:hypothetical protein